MNDDQPQFQALLAPDDEEIARLTASLAERIPKWLQHRGLGPDSDPEESDPLSRDQPWLAGLYAASVSGKTAFGPNAGRRVTRIGDQIDPESLDALTSPRCASVSGFSLHANVSVPAGDRQRLERLARYCARPPIAMERLEPLADGRTDDGCSIVSSAPGVMEPHMWFSSRWSCWKNWQRSYLLPKHIS